MVSVEIMNPTSLILCFIAGVAADIGWARYISSIASGRRLSASCWSAALTVLGLVVAYWAVNNPVTILASAAGAFVGTYFGTEDDDDTTT